MEVESPSKDCTFSPIQVQMFAFQQQQAYFASGFSTTAGRRGGCKIHNCLRDDESQILGLLSVKDYPEELRIHINLIEVIKSQVGKAKTLMNT